MKNHKWQLILLNWLLIWLPAQAQNGWCCDQGYPEAGPVASIDIDGDGSVDVYYSLRVKLRPPLYDPAIHDLEYEIRGTVQSVPLMPTLTSSFFKYGARIVSPPSIYTDVVNPTDYGAYNGPGGWQYGYANDDFAGNKLTNIYVGFVLTQSDGRHFGWLHMSRPDLKVKTPFAVVDYAYNPVPEAPIQAGIPAPPPVISTQLTPGGIQLAWPASISGWTLQTTTDLKGNAIWQDYSTGTTNLLVPMTETWRYFRLVKP
jgi:hypothetical protein